jgi:hypothetical protein
MKKRPMKEALGRRAKGIRIDIMVGKPNDEPTDEGIKEVVKEGMPIQTGTEKAPEPPSEAKREEIRGGDQAEVDPEKKDEPSVDEVIKSQMNNEEIMGLEDSKPKSLMGKAKKAMLDRMKGRQ